MYKSKKVNNKEKGITLIALIITIIILLILAGVTINLILGDNGLFSMTEEAVIKTKIKEVEEYAQLSYMDEKAKELIGEGKATLSVVISDLRKRNYIIKEIVNEENIVSEILLSKNDIAMQYRRRTRPRIYD